MKKYTNTIHVQYQIF